jgi:hypothetical protein
LIFVADEQAIGVDNNVAGELPTETDDADAASISSSFVTFVVVVCRSFTDRLILLVAFLNAKM